MDREFKQMQKALAANLLRLRAAKNLTQEQLAFEAEVDRTYVSRIERCLKNPSLLIFIGWPRRWIRTSTACFNREQLASQVVH